MAYDFNGTTATLELSSALVSAAPLTLFARVATDTTAAGNATIVSIGGSAGTHLFQLRRVGDVFEATTSEGATIGVAQTPVPPAPVGVGTFYPVAAVFSSATSRTIYMTPGAGTTDTTSVTPTSLNRTNIGARYSAGALGSFFDGQICEVAIWNAAITADEYTNLFIGASPKIIRPQSLVAYFPLIANANDIKANQALTITAATVAPHHRVRNPPHRS